MAEKISNREIQKIKIATPAVNPPAGYVYEYFKADGLLYTKDENGVEVSIGGMVSDYTNTLPAPTINEDIDSGWLVGSVIADVNSVLWICIDNSIGAAVWGMLTYPDPNMSQVPTRIRDVKNLIYSEEAVFIWHIQDVNYYRKREYEFFLNDNGSTDNVSVRLYDATNMVELGALTGIVASGLYVFTFIKPATDASVEVQVKKDTDLSVDWELRSGIVELIGMP